MDCKSIPFSRGNRGNLNLERKKTMQTKQFHLGDVLSIITGRLVSKRHIDGVYNILNFMTGDDLFTHQLPRAGAECKPYLIGQFPQLVGVEMNFAITELGDALKAKSGKAEMADAADADKIVADWPARQVAKYGEMFSVKPIPKGAHEFKNPIAEAEEMMGGPEKVIVVTI